MILIEVTTLAERRRVLAVLVATSLFAYVIVAALAYYHGFFSQFDPNTLQITAGGMGLPNGQGRFSVISWPRVPIHLATILLLAFSAWGLFVGRSHTRLVALYTYLGLLAPQAIFLGIYLNHFGGQSVLAATVISALLVVVPAALLAGPGTVARFDSHDVGPQWATLASSRWRLLIASLLVTYFALGAGIWVGLTSMWSEPTGRWLAYSILPLSALSVLGLLRLRGWGVFLATATGLTSSVLAGVTLHVFSADVARAWWLLTPAPLVLVIALTAPVWKATLFGRR